MEKLDANGVAGDEVVEEGQVSGAVAVDADAADVMGEGSHHPLRRSAHVGVLDAETLDGGAVGHGDGRAHAHAVDDGSDAAAKGLAVHAGDEDTAAPEGGAGGEHDILLIGAGGVVDIDVAIAKDIVRALLDGGIWALAGAVAGRGHIAVHKLDVAQQRVAFSLSGFGAGRVFGREVGVFHELGSFQTDLGIAHDHLRQAGGEIA